MKGFDRLHKIWADVSHDFMRSPEIIRITEGNITPTHYAAFLRETYFYTRENPQIQALSTAWFRGTDRKLVKAFLGHAKSEVGHDGLAIDDLRSLGFDTDGIQNEEPLPETIALISFPFYAIQYRSPLPYLGYLYFLEFLPTSHGEEIARSLISIGISPEQMRFIFEHRTVDEHHNELMRLYADTMLNSEEKILEVTYCLRVTANLYRNLVRSAFDSVDLRHSPLRRLTAITEKEIARV